MTSPSKQKKSNSTSGAPGAGGKRSAGPSGAESAPQARPTRERMSPEIDGVVQGHRDGHGFFLPDDGSEDIYLSADEMRQVMHRDRVRVRVTGTDRRGRPEGRVVEILERKPQRIIGRVLVESGVYLVAPEDRRFGQDIIVAPNGLAGADVGHVVAVELTESPSLYSQPVGRVVEVLGEIDDPGMEIEIAVRKYHVPHIFPEAVEAQAKGLPDIVRPVDKRSRVDLRDVPLVTIDGEDARDFDDAVYAEPARVGRGKGWRLVVAIADVSYYVKSGSPLDDEAYQRSTSVYFPRRVIPMLPEKLSNGLCSLKPDEDRLSLVCDMLVTQDGNVHAYQFYPAVICSHARLTYTEVAAVLQNTRGPEATRRADLVPHLLSLHEVYRALLKSRGERGAVDFDTTETQIVCDEQGRIERIVPRTRTEAHRLIEEAMLAANVCAAEFIEMNKQPSLFRVHEGPTPEKRQVLQAYLRSLGVPFSMSEEPHPREFQAIAEATRDRPDAQQVHSMLLRSMQQAIYTPINSGHFGLAYPAYTHFTSPIRRYPDLLVHRVIRGILAEKGYQLSGLSLGDAAEVYRGRRTPSPKLKADLGQWEVAGLHCSANERRADEASRDVESWLKCRFMREHLGEEFAGTVSAATSFGLFVQLDELYVEGLVHISELGGEYFRFDEAKQELRGERTGQRFAVGSRLRIQVIRVDLDSRRIDFRLATEESTLRNGVKGGKPASAQQQLASVKAKDRAAKQAKRSAVQARSQAREEGLPPGPTPEAWGKALKAAKQARQGQGGREPAHPQPPERQEAASPRASKKGGRRRR